MTNTKETTRAVGTVKGVVLVLRSGRFSDSGAGLTALLGGLLTLGVLVVAVLMALPSSQGGQTPLPAEPTTSAPGHAGVTSPNPDGIEGIIGSAALMVCKTDYRTVESAVSYYQAHEGSLPKSLTDLKPMLRSPVSSPYFLITIDPRKPGVVEVGTRGYAPAPGDANCAFAG
ncbi:MAG TPA: hypothetical protein VMS00_00020 [Acidimicrobiales bacterium]|nr:hypothetical protein [Acidimicrobiales bacterium]